MGTLMNNLNFAIAYLDNILIQSENREQDIQHVHVIFGKINEYWFKRSDEKCEFFMTNIKYLGQIIDENDRKPDPT